MGGFTKLRREIEPRWVAEYVSKFYPAHEASFRVPLGPVPEEWAKELGEAKAVRAYRPWRPEADALVKMPNRLVLIEGKVFKYMDGAAKLPLYKALVPFSPDLKDQKGKEISMELLLPVDVQWVRIVCDAMGIRLVVWCPDWLKPIWEERDRYWLPENVLARQKRKEKLRELGYE